MKNKLLFILLIYGLMISAQNTVTGSSDEKERDSEKIIKLINRLKESESKKEARIEEFIKLNPETKKTYHKNGKVNVIFDIVNNVPVYISNENRAAGIATKTNSLYPGGSLGLDLEGEGMTIGVWEVGGYPLVNHVEFLEDSGVSRITTPDTSSLNPEESFHATHVNGTIGAKGENSSAKGMAPKSTILAYNSSGETFETVNAFTNNDMLVSNHSYGVYIYDDDNEQQVDDWYMGSYTNGAKNWDDIHHEVPKYLKVTSAGNSGNDNYSNGLGYGYDKLTSDKNSKNSLIVASAQVNFNFLQTQVTSMRISSFSSQGPTDDGRIKPDITGRGESVYSASNGGPNDYGNSQGTSMSCPNVAGSLLLLQEHYNNLNDKFMWSSTLRGLACHTATDDAEDPSIINGGVYLGPDPFWGWGLLNAELAAQTIINEQSNTAIIEENTLLNGATYSFTVNVSDADKLMVTLCWTDPSGPLQNNILNSTMPVLVNDLDIRITDNSNNEYLPWRLDLSALPYAIKGDNIVDNIERVEVDFPSVGQYTITVSHKGLLAGFPSPGTAQDYSLIVTGSDMTLSAGNNDLSDFMIWPNPAKELINYQFASATEQACFIQLVDLQGRVVYSQNILGGSATIQGKINTSSYSKGVYLLSLSQGNQKTHKKVVLQ